MIPTKESNAMNRLTTSTAIPTRALKLASAAPERIGLGTELELPGLDLGEVKHQVDEVEEVDGGAVHDERLDKHEVPGSFEGAGSRNQDELLRCQP
jgi:hypothetical protein